MSVYLHHFIKHLAQSLAHGRQSINDRRVREGNLMCGVYGIIKHFRPVENEDGCVCLLT